MTDHPDASALYAILRQQIEHEDGLMTQRLSWLVASQSFLFTAYAIALNAPEHAASPMHALQQAFLLKSIPTVAISSDVLIYASIVGGILAMHALRHQWFTAGAGSALPPVQGSPLHRILGLASPMLLPLVFLSVWVFLLSHGGGHVLPSSPSAIDR